MERAAIKDLRNRSGLHCSCGVGQQWGPQRRAQCRAAHGCCGTDELATGQGPLPEVGVPDIALRRGHDELIRDTHRHLLSPLRRPRECHKYTLGDIRCQWARDEQWFATNPDALWLGDGSWLGLDGL